MRRNWTIILFACQSFAWFTSKDEVTNRLSASADYGVKIVESYAPPENFLPGQQINKDVYAVNTGNIPAYVKETVTSKLSITKEVADDTEVALTDGKFTKTDRDMSENVELKPDEVYVMEAGSYLAYAPTASNEEPGRKVVDYKASNPDVGVAASGTQKVYITTWKEQTAGDSTPDDDADDVFVEHQYRLTEAQFNEVFGGDGGAYVDGKLGTGALAAIPANDWTKTKANWTETEVSNAKTDFTPDVEGLYVFRRTIDVAKNNSEMFEYEGYYYKDGHYYKLRDLTVTPDNRIDMANDGDDTDGRLSNATFKLAKDVKEVVVPTLTYDQANNRLIATYGNAATKNSIIGDGTTGDLTDLAKQLDKAEHELTDARARLDSALSEKASSDATVAADQASLSALQTEIDRVTARINQLNGLIGDTSTAGSLAKRVDDLETSLADGGADKNAVEGALTTLYGASHKGDFDDDGINLVENRVTDDNADYADTTKYGALLKAQREYDVAKANAGPTVYTAYLEDLKDYFGTGGGYNGTGMTSTQREAVTNATTFEEAVAAIPYEVLKTLPNYNGTTDNCVLHAKTVALLKAQLEYDQAKKAAEDAVSKYNSDKTLLGTGETENDTSSTAATVGGKNVSYTGKHVKVTDPAASGLKGELAALEAEKASMDEYLAKLNEAYTQTANDAVNHATVNGATNTAADNLDEAKTNYNNKYATYVAKKQAYDQKMAEYDAAQDLKIYINLDNVVTDGGVAHKWQIVPVGTENLNDETANTDTATFYYTSILGAGKTSTKLIDSLELASDVTQDMYKSFDFDLDVALDSRQITYKYDANNVEVIGDDALVGFGATVKLDNNKDVDTALTWTKADSVVATDPSSGDETNSKYDASIIKAGAYTVVEITKSATIVEGESYAYYFMDVSDKYVANSTAAGTVYKKIMDDPENAGQFVFDEGSYTLTQAGIKQTT